MTIRRKLTVLYAGLLTFIIVLFGASVVATMQYVMIDNIDRDLSNTAEQIISNSKASHTNGDVTFDIVPLDNYRATNMVVQIWDVQTNIPRLHESSANLAWLETPLNRDAMNNDIHEYSSVILDEERTRIHTQPITIGDEIVGYIQVGTSLAQVKEASETLVLIILIACAVAILGGSLLSSWFAHRTLKPISDITKVASKVAVTDDLSTRIQWNGSDDEVGRLISVFNHMMMRIERLFSVQQRFVADISHELRTPLTVIKGNLELAQRYGMDDTSLNALNAETTRMSRLINDLLMLARADYGGINVPLSTINFSDAVQEGFIEGKALAVERDLDIQLAYTPALKVNGNIERLRQLVVNLMNNAVKFTPDGGKITVCIQQQADHAVLMVTDTGIGIAPHEQERIFDRFYQTDASRQHQSGDGFGLGLSVVQWIVKLHGGTIEVESVRGQGTTFTVQIPLFGAVKTIPDTGELTDLCTNLSLQSNSSV